jgi:hypothetical protein
MRPLNRYGILRGGCLCCAIPAKAIVDSGVQRAISLWNENLGTHDNEVLVNDGNFLRGGVLPLSLVNVQRGSICDVAPLPHARPHIRSVEERTHRR